MACLRKIIDLEEKTMLKFDTLKNDYPSRRSVIYGRKGMVCTSQPLAAQARIDIAKRGNAIDGESPALHDRGADINGSGDILPGADERGASRSQCEWKSAHGDHGREGKKTGIHRDAEAWLDSGDGPRRSFSLGRALGKVWKTDA